MAGVRRVLGNVGKTVSGVLGAVLGEPAAPPQAPALPAAPPADVHPGPDAAPDQPAVQPPDQPLEPAVTAPVPPAPEALDTEPADLPADLPRDLPAPDPDPLLAAAVDQAREAAVEVGGAAVGEHLGLQVEDDADDPGTAVLTHAFASTDPAYVGWHWAVTLARAAGSDRATVDEVVLLPGTGALLAPAWVPWSERLQPGDLSAGELLPTAPDDPRLVPAYAEDEPGGPELADEVGWELGLGRPRVLSLEGRLDAAERWWDGDHGPDTPIARQAPGRCADCGFLVRLAGGLRQAFGVCANAYAPDDGRVVALAHGCGAHSETVVEPQHAATAGMAVEDDEFDLTPVLAGGPAQDEPDVSEPDDEPAAPVEP